MDIDFNFVYLLPRLHKPFDNNMCLYLVFTPVYFFANLPFYAGHMTDEYKRMPTCIGHFSLN